MEAWVIKRDDGKYFSVASHSYERYWNRDLLYCHHFRTFKDASTFLKDQEEIQRNSVIGEFNNCKVVKIKICEVEEDE